MAQAFFCQASAPQRLRRRTDAAQAQMVVAVRDAVDAGEARLREAEPVVAHPAAANESRLQTRMRLR